MPLTPGKRPAPRTVAVEIVAAIEQQRREAPSGLERLRR